MIKIKRPEKLGEVKSCVIFADEKNKKAVNYSVVLKKELEEAGIKVFDYPSRPDLFIVLGGDGTMLRARDHFDCEGPFFGLNFGDKGFLMNEVKEDVVQEILQGRLEIKSFPLLMIESGGIRTKALNDFYLNRGGGRNCKVKVKINGRPIAKVSGDGIIVSTSLGSTAYNLGAGGFAVSPELHQAICLTPICVHAPIQLKPIVLPLWSKIEIEILNFSEAEVKAWRDGMELPSLGPKIEIPPEQGIPVEWVKLAFWEGIDFTQQLVEKIMKIPEV